MGAISFALMGSFNEEPTNADNFEPLVFILRHYLEMCLLMISVGVGYLVSGIYLRKFKLWARRLVIVISAVLIIVMWGIMGSVAYTSYRVSEVSFFAPFAIIIAALFSLPLLLLIKHLRKDSVESLFQ